MSKARRFGSYMLYAIRKFRELGIRTIMGCFTALVAALLIAAAPEVGVGVAFGGLVLGGVSAYLIHPH